MPENVREIALDVLLAAEREKVYSHRLIHETLDKYDYWTRREKSFLKRLTEGTIERQIELDYYLDQMSSVPARKMKPFIRCLLRMSLYQILYMDGTPERAVCSEACKIAQKRGFGSLKGFVNGLLRNLIREKERLPLPDVRKEPLLYLSVKYSMPEWIVKRWVNAYGMRVAETVLEELLRVHPVSLRFAKSLSLRRREELLEALERMGAETQRSAYLPYVVRVKTGRALESLPGFLKGLYTVQDVSSALAVEAAGIRPGDFVIDVCASPGGKSILAAETAGRVLARDISLEKTQRIRQAAARMRVENVTVQAHDARVFDESLEGRADVVLLDVPCSGLGVIGKKRDIKYRVREEDLSALAALQREIVAVCSRYVKPGGTLLYSTCTIDSQENEEMVRFIREELSFVPLSLRETLPQQVFADQKKARLAKTGGEGGIALEPDCEDACIQLLPGYTEGDGFFLARFRRGREGSSKGAQADD